MIVVVSLIRKQVSGFLRHVLIRIGQMLEEKSIARE
jgi:hypothetical protein